MKINKVHTINLCIVMIMFIVFRVCKDVYTFFNLHNLLLLYVIIFLFILSQLSLVSWFFLSLKLRKKYDYNYQVKIPRIAEDEFFLSVFNKQNLFTVLIFLIFITLGFLYFKVGIFTFKNLLFYLLAMLLLFIGLCRFELFNKMKILTEKYNSEDVTGQVISSIYYIRENSNGITEIKREAYKLTEKQENKIDVAFTKASALYMIGKLQETIDTLEKIDLDNYQDTDAFCLLSCCYARLEQNDKALMYINKALVLKQNDNDILLQKSCILSSLGQKEKALEILLKFEQAEFKDAGVFELIASIYFEKDEFFKALEYANKAIQLDPKSKDAIELKKECLNMIDDDSIE